MSAELLFETNNYVSFGVRWKRDNTAVSGFVPSGGEEGVCQALTVRWLHKSIRSGGVRSISELYPMPVEPPEDFQFNRELNASTLAGCMQSAFTSLYSAWGGVPSLNILCSNLSSGIASHMAHLGIYGLFEITIMKGEGSPGGLTKIIDNISSRNGHFALRLVYKNVTAHLMGFRHDGQIFQWFEPNIGLYEYSDKESFIKHNMLLCIQYGLFSNVDSWKLHEVVAMDW